MSQRGRPRRVVPVDELDLLTVPQVVLYLQLKGRPMSRTKVKAAIVSGRLRPVYLDWEHLDRLRQPTYRIDRLVVDRWIRASLQLLNVVPAAS